ncbi:exopolysaccharide biosynthesis protein [Litchfieldella rifensis]|uniref:Exopolysaccharide biosynthesis protein n=1 Tax=Litchfieldella rifensis TaxID=762643 RepID=A0ABV7LS36_9GAMM
MSEHDRPVSLVQLLECIEHAELGRDRVTLGEILDAVGRRSFGPLLLVAGLVTLAPVIGDIPGMPTLMACMVLLVAGQLLWRREHFWLPAWLLERSVSRTALDKGMNWLYSPARYVDRLLRPRLTRLVGDAGVLVIALCCVLIALAMPPMEVIPFSANGAGLALTLFGLALIASDGLMALVAFALTFTTFAVIAFNLF